MNSDANPSQKKQLRALPAPLAATPLGLQWDEAEVGQGLDGCRFRLCDGRLAQQALSCVITPEPGDRVLLLQGANTAYITHVLQREANRAQLRIPGVDMLSITQPGLEVNAASHIALRSLGDVELVSAQGSVSVSARHILACATETLVQNAQHLVTHVQHCVLQVAALLRVHGKQTLITAEQDMKLDAERISLG
jgi:hypothetical protein